ncbi:hypothetical protein BSL78_02503 [Apostichopus japonicus]|uniref:Uncharacterized protein n=1 Tax=Stichopus japonicus TaxID=307972 RepID=A0A2G8LJY1_STIJA|nr:hypothetical protein BSL78_02503 [Apostichopus japonicus]
MVGKHRRYRHVTDSMLANMQKRLAIEQENARHLSTPYLSKEESFRHMWPLKAAKTDAFMKEKYFAKVKPHKTMEEHLAFLKTTRTW